MKSRSGSSDMKTMTLPRRIVPIGSSTRSAAWVGPKDELVDQQVIADEQVLLHRAGRDLERLHDEVRMNSARITAMTIDSKYSRSVDFLKSAINLSHQPSPSTIWRYSVSVPIFSTARNASCRICTLPTCFMRFLPSFCFSSSLRLREMSP